MGKPKTEKTSRVVRDFRVDYYDDDDRVHIHMTESTEIRSGRGREWQQETSTNHHDWLVLELEEFRQIVEAGTSALIYQIDAARRAGLRTDYKTEQPYTIKPIELRPESEED